MFGFWKADYAEVIVNLYEEVEGLEIVPSEDLGPNEVKVERGKAFCRERLALILNCLRYCENKGVIKKDG